MMSKYVILHIKVALIYDYFTILQLLRSQTILFDFRVAEVDIDFSNVQ